MWEKKIGLDCTKNGSKHFSISSHRKALHCIIAPETSWFMNVTSARNFFAILSIWCNLSSIFTKHYWGDATGSDSRVFKSRTSCPLVPRKRSKSRALGTSRSGEMRSLKSLEFSNLKSQKEKTAIYNNIGVQVEETQETYAVAFIKAHLQAKVLPGGQGSLTGDKLAIIQAHLWEIVNSMKVQSDCGQLQMMGDHIFDASILSQKRPAPSPAL